MKRKILVPMFASVMALSMNSIANAEEVENKNIENKEENKNTTIKLDEYEEVTYKLAKVKEGIAVKVREEGAVQDIAYTGDEFKVIGVQGEWVEVAMGDNTAWVAKRFVDIEEAHGYITADTVNFRKEASTESEVVDELEIASSVKVLEDNGDWLKVKKDEEEGYVSSLYVSHEKPVIEVEESDEAEESIEVEESTTNVEENNQDSNNNDATNNSNSNESGNSSNSSNLGSSSNSNGSDSSNSNNNSGQTEKPSQDNNESVNPPTSNTSAAQAVVDLAYSKLGSPYVWGAEGPSSFDCSGLMYYIFKNGAGVTLPRTSGAQSGVGQTVSKSNLQPGDLIFSSTNGSGSVSHVGVYVGGGYMIHAPGTGDVVKKTNINNSYWDGVYLWAKRVL